MKFLKYAALILVLSMSTAVAVSCSDNTNNLDETTASIENTKATTTAATEEVQLPTLEETTLASQDESVFDYGEYGVNAYAFNAYLEYIDTIEEESEEEMHYLFCNTYVTGQSDWTLLAGPAQSNTYTQYYLADGRVVEGSSITEDYMAFSANEIKNMPVMFTSGYTSAENYHLESSIPDGTYYGKIFGVSLDGTKIYAELSEPVLIPVTEYDGLDHADSIIDIYGNPVVLPFKGALVVSGTYEYGKATTMFDDDFYFEKQPDGTCILLNSDESVVTYNSRYVVLEIAPDAAISDNFLSLYNKSDDITVLPNDGDTNILKSFYFQCMTDNEYMGTYNVRYNDWSSSYGTLSPVIVSNGVAIDLTISWK